MLWQWGGQAVCWALFWFLVYGALYCWLCAAYWRRHALRVEGRLCRLRHFGKDVYRFYAYRLPGGTVCEGVDLLPVSRATAEREIAQGGDATLFVLPDLPDVVRHEYSQADGVLGGVAFLLAAAVLWGILSAFPVGVAMGVFCALFGLVAMMATFVEGGMKITAFRTMRADEKRVLEKVRDIAAGWDETASPASGYASPEIPASGDDGSFGDSGGDSGQARRDEVSVAWLCLVLSVSCLGAAYGLSDGDPTSGIASRRLDLSAFLFLIGCFFTVLLAFLLLRLRNDYR